MMSSAVRRAPSHWYLGLDRGLPELAAAFDLPAVSRLYEERWPGRAPAGLGLRVFHEDPDLPSLADAADPEKVDRHLRALGFAPGSRVVRVIPLRYKPGSQCLLRFDLEAGSVPGALYGKVLAIDGHLLSRTLSALRAIDGGRYVPRVLQP